MNSTQTVSAIIPARNEESNIARAVRSLTAQPEIMEVVVVDDQSSDGTVRVLEQLATVESKLRWMEAGPLPEGWTGKNHAVWRGAASAGGTWLLFTDADATHLPGSTALALAQAAEEGAALVSYSPGQELHFWWEKALIPFIFCRLAQLYSYSAVNDPASAAAAANGQYLLIRRDAYDRIGGHASVSGEVLEDVALARRAKEAGVVLHFSSDEKIARVRMYTSFAAMWEGWTKNLFPLITVPGQTITRELFTVIPCVPMFCLLLSAAHPIFGALGVMLLAGRHASYAAMLRRNRFSSSGVLYYLAGMGLYAAALVYSDWRYARGKVSWKGRQYAVKSSGT